MNSLSSRQVTVGNQCLVQRQCHNLELRGKIQLTDKQQNPRGNMRAVASLCATLLLTACQSSGVTGSGSVAGSSDNLGNNSTTGLSNRSLSAEVSGERIGNARVRVALLVPQSASGPAGIAGREIALAAKLAMQDFSRNQFELVIKDTKGQAAEAAILAGQARDEGASLVLGPLFSANVSSASGVTEPSRLPMIAFTSDIARARPNVYLLSFAPDADIRRTLNFGISSGFSRVVAILPNSSYGRLAEQEMRQTLEGAGGQVVAVARYSRDSNSVVEAARSIALSLANADAIYIPEGGQIPSAVLKSLKGSGVDLKGKQILGSGQWSNVDHKDPALNGAIYASADRTNFVQFAGRFRSVHNKEPSVTAGLGYDAVGLVAELFRRNAQAPFTKSALESRVGFIGSTGIFRFESNGRLQRALVVNRIENKQPVLISPAPQSFGGAS